VVVINVSYICIYPLVYLPVYSICFYVVCSAKLKGHNYNYWTVHYTRKKGRR